MRFGRILNEHLIWHKDIWIIPIHCLDPEVGHWVLCIAHVQTQKLLLFDSLAERDGWMLNIAVRFWNLEPSAVEHL